MKIATRQPLGYSEIGRKERQEDAVWPAFEDVTAASRCFVLCDGVGGSEHGEIASQTASRVIGEYMAGVLRVRGYVTEDDMGKAVGRAYDELERLDTAIASTGKVSMATTLTCVCLHSEGVLAAHMGDSRIYHVRPGVGLRYRSDDHSLANTLIKAGELTVEEARTFPKRNVITKAIQPHCNARQKAEVHQLTDIRPGDYLFLCCDGVLEHLTDERLAEVLQMQVPDKEKIRLLEAESTGRTRDNYTAYLIPIASVSGMPALQPEAGDVEITHVSTPANTCADNPCAVNSCAVNPDAANSSAANPCTAAPDAASAGRTASPTPSLFSRIRSFLTGR